MPDDTDSEVVSIKLSKADADRFLEILLDRDCKPSDILREALNKYIENEKK